MLRLLFDQDFNHDILRGLLLRLPDVDGVTALQAGLEEAADPELLDWAAQQRRYAAHVTQAEQGCDFDFLPEPC
jgi:hypothetical protein